MNLSCYSCFPFDSMEKNCLPVLLRQLLVLQPVGSCVDCRTMQNEKLEIVVLVAWRCVGEPETPFRESAPSNIGSKCHENTCKVLCSTQLNVRKCITRTEYS